MSKPSLTKLYGDREALRAEFERVINEEARIYNLVRKNDNDYFSLHTERAWKTFQMGFNCALEAME